MLSAAGKRNPRGFCRLLQASAAFEVEEGLADGCQCLEALLLLERIDTVETSCLCRQPVRSTGFCRRRRFIRQKDGEPLLSFDERAALSYSKPFCRRLLSVFSIVWRTGDRDHQRPLFFRSSFCLAACGFRTGIALNRRQGAN